MKRRKKGTGTIERTAEGLFRARFAFERGGRRADIGLYASRPEAEAALARCGQPREFKRSRLDSGVYFIQAGTDGPIKIGYAASVADRLSQIQTCNPIELRLLGVVRGAARGLEMLLHREFGDAHVRGEWFCPTKTLLRRITEIVALDEHASIVRPRARPRRDVAAATEGVQ